MKKIKMIKEELKSEVKVTGQIISLGAKNVGNGVQDAVTWVFRTFNDFVLEEEVEEVKEEVKVSSLDDIRRRRESAINTAKAQAAKDMSIVNQQSNNKNKNKKK